MNLLSYKNIGHGDPLIIVHGYLGGQKMWKNQECLSKKFNLIIPSLAGYGESTNLSARSSIKKNAEDIFNLVEKLKIKKFNLLGHSMGGMIVQEMTFMRPDKINKLICFGTGSIGKMPNRFETIDESKKKISKFGISKVGKEIAKTWFVDFKKNTGYKLCMTELNKTSTKSSLTSINAWANWNGRKRLKNIKCPTLIIWGEKDLSYDWKQQQILLREIKNSKIKIIKKCAHNAHMEKPKTFNSAIREFLNK